MTEGLKSLGQNYVDNMEKAVPCRKVGTGFDIANAALFLALKVWYVNGHNLIIDGESKSCQNQQEL